MNDDSGGHRQNARHFDDGSSRKDSTIPDIARLNHAIDSLNDDAEGMHALIARATDELERATAEGKKTADLAGEALATIGPLAEELRAAIGDAKGLVDDTGKVVSDLTGDLARACQDGREAFDSFAEASLGVSKELAAETERAIDRLNSSIAQAQESGKGAFEAFVSESRDLSADTKGALLTSISQAQEAGLNAFESFSSSTLKASEKTRDDLQTDLLSHKTAMSARMDSLEATTTRSIGDLEATVSRLSEDTKRIEEMVNEKSSQLEKRIAIPLYAVIGVALLQLLTLAALFLR